MITVDELVAASESSTVEWLRPTADLRPAEHAISSDSPSLFEVGPHQLDGQLLADIIHNALVSHVPRRQRLDGVSWASFSRDSETESTGRQVGSVVIRLTDLRDISKLLPGHDKCINYLDSSRKYAQATIARIGELGVALFIQERNAATVVVTAQHLSADALERFVEAGEIK